MIFLSIPIHTTHPVPGAPVVRRVPTNGRWPVLLKLLALHMPDKEIHYMIAVRDAYGVDWNTMLPDSEVLPGTRLLLSNSDTV
jgi:hypothetical protein